MGLAAGVVFPSPASQVPQVGLFAFANRGEAGAGISFRVAEIKPVKPARSPSVGRKPPALLRFSFILC